MVKITAREDCGNAPKKLFLKDFIAAIVKNNKAFLTHYTTDDIQWSVVGGKSIGGKKEVLTAFQQTRREVEELIVNTIVTHGYNGVVEGLFKFKDNRTIAFCDIYLFRASTNNAPIKAVTTYAVALG